MPDIKQKKILELLSVIETNLKLFNFWQESPPPDELFTSNMPFCHDTMALPQWLQFIFLEKMRLMLSTGAQLPNECAIAPYAEEYFKNTKQYPDALLVSLEAIDNVLSYN